MTFKHRSVCGAMAIILWAGPAAAQEPEWARDLAKDIQAHAERHAETMARAIGELAEKQGETIGRAIGELAERQGQTIGRAIGEIAARHAETIAVALVLEAQRPSPPSPPSPPSSPRGRRAAEQAAREAERQRRQDERRGPEYTEQVSKTLKIGRNGTFDLQNVSGTIVVTGGGGSDVRLEATKRVRHRNESEAKSLLQDIDIQIYERNGNVEVRTDYPRRNWSGGVDYTVSLPRDVSVVLRSVSGDIRVTSLNGELRAESVSGNVAASAVRRIRQAKSVSGNVEIADSEGDEVAGNTVSGDVIARNLKVRTLDVQSVSGGLRMLDVESDRATARSVSGDIEFSGRLARNGRYDVQSHSGNLRVTPIGAQGFTLEASTFSGDVRSDYPLTMQGNLGSGYGPRRLNRGVRGSFGDGGATLSLRSFSGNIVVVKR
jgi:DUF4097 and DUF4098 domain-containing protein YvlB